MGVSKVIGSSMKSVGEVMAIGRTFEEAIQKGLRMVGQGTHGFVGNSDIEFDDIRKALAEPTDMRIYSIASAFEAGITLDEIHRLTRIDKWFLVKLKAIYDTMLELKGENSLENLDPDLLLAANNKAFLISRSPGSS
jgi:carbamoyl-phosphate synthase large subunit